MAIRLAFLRVNHAEYTDGILQLTLFSKGNPYWPPFYPALAVSLGAILGDPELGGRLVSAILGGLAVIPVALIGQKLGGRRVAIFAAVFYLVLPSGLRWGVRVMTDATFFTLFATSIWLLMPRKDEYPSSRQIALATVFSVLATLTRYQGLLLIFPIAFALLRQLRMRRPSALALATQALWLAVPGWILRGGFAHLQQVLDRKGTEYDMTVWESALAYWSVAESYLYLYPYALTPTIFLAFLAGLFSSRSAQPGAARWLLGMFILSALLIGASQAAFVHYDFRYMFPLGVFIVPFAGLGLNRLFEVLGNRKILHGVALLICFVPPTIFSVASVLLQREAFGDIKAASQYVGENIPPESRVFTNERYNNDIPVVKTAFWADREVLPDPELQGYLVHRGLALGTPRPEQRNLRADDIFILTSTYSVGRPGQADHLGKYMLDYFNYLSARYRLTVLEEFRAEFTPLLTDIMARPGAHASPMAWIFRYQPQECATFVIRIDGVKK